MESSSQDRNLPASERKLRRAKEDGQVARSRELSHLAVLGVGALALMALAPFMFDRLEALFVHQMHFDHATMATPGAMLERLRDMSLWALGGCTIFASVIAVAVIAGNLAVGGWVASTKPILPDLSRINPLSGFGKLFSKERVSELTKIVVIVSVLSAVATWYLMSTTPGVASTIMQPSQASLDTLNGWLIKGLGLMLLVLLAVALVDVPLQKLLHKSRLKMSHQEFKQEHKESEGNPHLKRRLRTRAREIVQGNSIRAVPRADFVVMNPTHYAVAVRYDESEMRAPRVISRGTDILALKIRDMARQHAIPLIESPRLARALYAHAELDQDIPHTLYTAVAQVLAYVYRLKAAMRGEAPMPGDAPIPEVPDELDPLSAESLIGGAAP